MTMVVIFSYVIVTAALIAYLTVRPFRRIWLMVWGLAPIVLIYLENPGFRIFSFHSFMHASIVYQIANGRIPPPDPLLAGNTLHYPWIPHLLAAALCRLFNVTPFLAIPLLNMASLVLVIALVLRISRLIVNDKRLNLISAICAIYAFTPFIVEMTHLIHTGAQPEIRGIPLIDKFITINALPLGLVGWFLAIYGALMCYHHKDGRKGFLVVAAGIALVGSLYPAFLPGIGAAIFLGLAVSWLFWRSNMSYFVRSAIMLPIFFGIAFALLPYLRAISGSAAHAAILDANYLKLNTINYLFVNAPMLVLFALAARGLLSKVNRKALVILSVPIVSTFAIYVSIHLTFNNEYKFLLLSSTSLGVLGGPILGCLQKRLGRIAIFFILMIFLVPTFRIVWLRSSAREKVPNTFFEDGMVLKTKAKEQELYDWIRNQTPLDAIFIDTELEIPVLGQRQVLVPYSVSGRRQRKGYGNIRLILISQSGYGREVIERRTKIAKALYEPGENLRPEDWQYLSHLGKEIYVLARKPGTCRILEGKGFPIAYMGSDGFPAIYRLKPPILTE